MSSIIICIDVSHLEQATNFYTQVFDCSVIESHDTHNKIQFKEIEFYLAERKEGSIAIPNTSIERSYKRHWTPVHLDFKITDSEKTVKKIIKLGGSHEGTKTGDWGRFDFCSDPFGNGFCLSNLKPQH